MARQAEAALRDSQVRWELAIQGSDEGIWDWNAQTDTVFYSARWKEILGYKDEELPSTHEVWQSHIHPDDLPNVLRIFSD